MFDKERLKQAAKDGGNGWLLLAAGYLVQARDHLKTHKYTYGLLVIGLLVLLFKRRPELFKKALKYLRFLI